MKSLLIMIFAFVLLASCDRADRKANRMQRGNGRWNMTKWEKIAYDTTGKVLYDSIYTDIGEIIFFQRSSVNALFEYYEGVMKLSRMPVGMQVYRIEYYTDGLRFQIMSNNIPIEFSSYNVNKVFSVRKRGMHRQELEYVAANGNIQIGPKTNQVTYVEKLTLVKD